MKSKVLFILIIIVFIAGLLIANQKLNKSTNENEKMSAYSNDLNNEHVTKESVVQVNDDNFESEVLRSDKKVLVDFYADWCQPCKILSPLVEEVASENENIKVVKVNIDDNESLSNEYGIKYIPTLILFENGKEVSRNIGAIPKEKIEEMVK